MISRRKLLTGSSLLLSSAALAGCDVLDPLVAQDSSVRRVLARANDLTYRVHRLLFGNTWLAPEYTEADIRQSQRPNGTVDPDDADYKSLSTSNFARYQLKVGGLVERPLSLSLQALRKMPARTQITRHDCVEGWSCIAKWTGVQLATILAEAKPKSEAKFVVFRCFDTMENTMSGAVKYYGSIDMIDAYHPQTILAYDLNGKQLPVANGAPLRVRIERQLGYKMNKYVRSIELVASFKDIGDGNGGYWEDRGYDWYAGI